MVDYKNHLRIGSYIVKHRQKDVATNLASLEFRNFVKGLEEHLDWMICWVNNINDPFQQLNVGDRIKLINL